jgi:zinc protease
VLRAPESASYWLSWLPRIQAEPRMKETMLNEAAGLQAVTAEQVQAYFRDHIVLRPPIEVVARVALPVLAVNQALLP